MSESYKVTFGLKCFEKRTYVAKNISRLLKTVSMRTSSYEDMHNVARLFHKIPDVIKTFLAQYNGERIKHTFKNLEHYALLQKDKRKLYLFYPKSFAALEFKPFLKSSNLDHLDTSSDDDFDVVGHADTAVELGQVNMNS